DCIFCKIVAGKMHTHKIWEDEKHLAFLSIFPNTEGFSVVIPKFHYSTYAFDLPDSVLSELALASNGVGNLLDKAFGAVGSTGVIFEGFGVEHVHAERLRRHGACGMEEWRQFKSNVDAYCESYEGYIPAHAYRREDGERLAGWATKI